MLAYSVSQIQLLSGVGVLTDIAGALILSRSFILSKSKELAAQQSPRYAGNPSFLKALSEQAVDAHWGGSLLAIGFVLQFLSNMGLATSVGGFCVALVLLVLVVIFYWMLRTRRVKATYLAAVDKMDGSSEDKQVMRDLYPS
jgi:hypothetical protein